MVMGRPTDYEPERDYLHDADDYIKTCGREQTKLPKVEEFCDEKLGIDDDTAVEWCKKYPNSNFSSAIKRIKRIQKGQLQDDGMYGGKEVNSAMAIFLLKANHNMIETERQELNLVGDNLIIYKPEKNKE